MPDAAKAESSGTHINGNQSNVADAAKAESSGTHINSIQFDVADAAKAESSLTLINGRQAGGFEIERPQTAGLLTKEAYRDFTSTAAAICSSSGLAHASADAAAAAADPSSYLQDEENRRTSLIYLRKSVLNLPSTLPLPNSFTVGQMNERFSYDSAVNRSLSGLDLSLSNKESHAIQGETYSPKRFDRMDEKGCPAMEREVDDFIEDKEESAKKSPLGTELEKHRSVLVAELKKQLSSALSASSPSSAKDIAAPRVSSERLEEKHLPLIKRSRYLWNLSSEARDK